MLQMVKIFFLGQKHAFKNDVCCIERSYIGAHKYIGYTYIHTYIHTYIVTYFLTYM